MGYQIKTVSKMTGIPKNTLVAWERRYGVLSPDRQANGYRVYSDEDIAVLTQIKSALADGLKISEAVERVTRPSATPTAEPATPDGAFGPMRLQLRTALLDFDRGRADQLVQRLVTVPYGVVIEEVYFPILREVGDGWAQGDVSVAQEHYVSTYVRSQLGAMLLALGSGPKRGIHVACTTMPGDLHEIAALGLAVHLAASACRVTYFGANTPVDALGHFATDQRPAWLCISVIQPADLGEVVAYARRLREMAPAETSIAIGGAGLPKLDNTPVNGVEVMRDWSEFALLRGG